jgi:hypothetical protein
MERISLDTSLPKKNPDLTLSIMWVVHRMWIQTLELLWREEDASFVASHLCKEVLLLIIVTGRHIP